MSILAGHKLVSSDFDDLENPTRVGCRLRRAANQSVSNVTSTPISWDTADENTPAFITVTSTTVTIPAGCAGIYVVTFRAAGTTGGNARNYAEIAVTSSITGTPADFRFQQSGNSTENRLVAFFSGPLAVGDSFVVNIFQTTGGAQNFVAWLSCYQVAP